MDPMQFAILSSLDDRRPGDGRATRRARGRRLPVLRRSLARGLRSLARRVDAPQAASARMGAWPV